MNETTLMRKKYSKLFRAERRIEELEQELETMKANSARVVSIAWTELKKQGLEDDYIFTLFDREARWKRGQAKNRGDHPQMDSGR